MQEKTNLNVIYAHSEEDVVAREMHGEFIIIPIKSGIGDLDSDIFSLNETGKAIWEKLDGKKNLKEIINELSNEFEVLWEEISTDVAALTEELLKRKMLIEVN